MGFLQRTVRGVFNPIRPGRTISRGANPLRDVHNAVAVQYRGFYTFDISVIRTNWKRINRGPLTKAGNLVRAIARRSIKDKSARAANKYKPSPVGKPPYSLRGKTKAQKSGGGEGRPFKMIYSLPDMWDTSVMVGMVGFRRSNPVPGVHEHGMQAQRIVAVAPGQGGQGAFHTIFVPGVGFRRFRFAKKTVRYPERPFMAPALEKAVPTLPMLWQDSFANVPPGFVAGAP